MGCDIHSFVEIKRDGKWEQVNPELTLDTFDRERMGKSRGSRSPFNWRSYGMFGFLAGVRNYSEVPPISAPRGLPSDLSASIRTEFDDLNDHSASWLSLAELMAYDYSIKFSDMRVGRLETSGVFNGAARAFPGEETRVSLRTFLRAAFFDELSQLFAFADGRELRIVFWFDN